jgi:hypothetical protein
MLQCSAVVQYFEHPQPAYCSPAKIEQDEIGRCHRQCRGISVEQSPFHLSQLVTRPSMITPGKRVQAAQAASRWIARSVAHLLHPDADSVKAPRPGDLSRTCTQTHDCGKRSVKAVRLK